MGSQEFKVPEGSQFAGRRNICKIGKYFRKKKRKKNKQGGWMCMFWKIQLLTCSRHSSSLLPVKLSSCYRRSSCQCSQVGAGWGSEAGPGLCEHWGTLFSGHMCSGGRYHNAGGLAQWLVARILALDCGGLIMALMLISCMTLSKLLNVSISLVLNWG